MKSTPDNVNSSIWKNVYQTTKVGPASFDKLMKNDFDWWLAVHAEWTNLKIII